MTASIERDLKKINQNGGLHNQKRNEDLVPFYDNCNKKLSFIEKIKSATAFINLLKIECKKLTSGLLQFKSKMLHINNSVNKIKKLKCKKKGKIFYSIVKQQKTLSV